MSTPTTVTALRWASSWAVEPGPDLMLSAGADRRVAVDGIGSDVVERVRSWSAGAPVTPNDGIERRVVDRLVELGAVTPTWPMPKVLGVVAAGVRDADDAAVVAALGEHLAAYGHRLTDDFGRLAADDPAIVVRVGSFELPRLDRPHIGVDLRMHHTVVLGPLVVPGHSSCLGCLDHRLARRWAPATPPASPAVRHWLPAVAALVAVQLERAASGVSALVNATVAWDLEQGTTDRQSLYKVTGCAMCDAGSTSGRVSLPWAVDR